MLDILEKHYIFSPTEIYREVMRGKKVTTAQAGQGQPFAPENALPVDEAVILTVT